MFHYALKAYEKKTALFRDTTDLISTGNTKYPVVQDLDIQACPNQFVDSFKLSIQSKTGVQAELRLIDMSCQIIIRKELSLEAGYNNFAFDHMQLLHPVVYIPGISISGKIERKNC